MLVEAAEGERSVAQYRGREIPAQPLGSPAVGVEHPVEHGACGGQVMVATTHVVSWKCRQVEGGGSKADLVEVDEGGCFPDEQLPCVEVPVAKDGLQLRPFGGERGYELLDLGGELGEQSGQELPRPCDLLELMVRTTQLELPSWWCRVEGTEELAGLPGDRLRVGGSATGQTPLNGRAKPGQDDFRLSGREAREPSADSEPVGGSGGVLIVRVEPRLSKVPAEIVGWKRKGRQ